MMRTQYISFLFFACVLFVSYPVYSQQDNSSGVRDKVIVDGKTYYLHVVQKGEGFYGIAKKYGVSQKEIHESNPSAIFGLKPGDILNIPVISGRNSSADEMEKSVEFIYHTIEKGQTLYFLSKKYNVSIDDIKNSNVGADQNLLVGTIIKIPVRQQTESAKENNGFKYHTVDRKETLYGISKRYDVTVDTIIFCNPALKNGILSVGSKIRIPVKDKEHAQVLQEKNMEDETYIYHKIVAGETFFSISKKYTISQSVLAHENPDLNQEYLPLGYLVRVPKQSIKNNLTKGRKADGDFVQHVVRRKETVYSISNHYHVTVQDIEEANPDVVMSNIRKGMKLQIPTQRYLTNKKLDQKQNEQAKLKAQINKTRIDSIQVDCNGYDYQLNAETIKVAILLPFDLDATQKANIIKKIVGDKEEEYSREEPIISSRSRTFVEFYQGVLLAVDSMKKQGVHIHLFTYDTAPDTNRVKQILEQPEMKMVDFIIGPAYASNLSLVSDFSYKHQIKMIFPLSSVNSQLSENPFLFQINAPDTLLYANYAKHITSYHETSRIVILKSSKPGEKEEKLSLAIKNKLFGTYLPQGKSPDFMEISFSEKDVQGVEALLDKDKLNVVVIPSPDEADVSKIVTTLHGVSETTGIRIKLIGFGSWLMYQTINPEEIHDLDTEIITSYALDYEDVNTGNFIRKFRKMYYTEPYAVSPYFIRSGKNSKYSRYGIWGFDVMYAFLNARVNYGSHFEYCIGQDKIQQVQFNFDFKRSENWGGFYNNGLFILGFKPSLEIIRKPLQ